MSFWYPSDRGGLQLNMESRPRWRPGFPHLYEV
jgi:hypothetical protein